MGTKSKIPRGLRTLLSTILFGFSGTCLIVVYFGAKLICPASAATAGGIDVSACIAVNQSLLNQLFQLFIQYPVLSYAGFSLSGIDLIRSFHYFNKENRGTKLTLRAKRSKF